MNISDLFLNVLAAIFILSYSSPSLGLLRSKSFRVSAFVEDTRISKNTMLF